MKKIFTFCLCLYSFSLANISIRSIGTKAVYSSGAVSISGDSLTINLSGGTWDAMWGEGDVLNIEDSLCFVLSRNSATQITLQRKTAKTGSGLTYSIGRAYSTKAAWVAGEAKNLTTAQQIDRGVLCKDSPFSGVVTITGWTASATYYPELTVASHSQMSGKAIGTGVVVDRNNASGNVINIAQNYFRVSGFEIKNVVNSVGSLRVIYVDGSNTYVVRIENMVVHDVSTGSYTQMIHNNNAASGSIVQNCLIYNGFKTGAGAGAIIGLFGKSGYVYDNITVYNVKVASGATGSGTGVDGAVNEFSNPVFRNIISVECNECFKNHSGAAALNNISSDATAKGADYQRNIAASDLFNSIVSGSEDFRLKSTSPAKGTGYDLSGTFTTDIVSTIRTIPWDVGCFKFIPEIATRRNMTASRMLLLLEAK